MCLQKHARAFQTSGPMWLVPHTHSPLVMADHMTKPSTGSKGKHGLLIVKSWPRKRE